MGKEAATVNPQNIMYTHCATMQCGHKTWRSLPVWPRPEAHLQLVVATQLVVQPPLLDSVHNQAAAQSHTRVWRRLQ